MIIMIMILNLYFIQFSFSYQKLAIMLTLFRFNIYNEINFWDDSKGLKVLIFLKYIFKYTFRLFNFFF